MIVPEPCWTCSPERAAPVWEADVHLFPEHVACVLNGRIWFCLQRPSGHLLWERRRLGRPNRICGLAADVLVATEQRCNDGPSSADFGVYGISLAAGRLLWTSHAPGRWGRFLRLLDFIPDFTNELRDEPLHIDGEETLTFRGRRLEAVTGKDFGCREVPVELRRENERFASRLLAWKEVPIAGLGTLVAGSPENPEEAGVVDSGPLRFHLRSPEGEVRWEFDAVGNSTRVARSGSRSRTTGISASSVATRSSTSLSATGPALPITAAHASGC